MPFLVDRLRVRLVLQETKRVVRLRLLQASTIVPKPNTLLMAMSEKAYHLLLLGHRQPLTASLAG
jgi:hypothetical protein